MKKNVSATIFILAYIGVLISLTSSIWAEDAQAKEYLKHYTDSETIPEKLYSAYEKLIAAFSGGSEGDIKEFTLPESIVIERNLRPKGKEEYGGLNFNYIKTGFSPYILGAIKKSASVFLLRTGTSVLVFVETKNEGWKLYRYMDKPIN